ncbi:RNA polymerase sigma-70 factor [Mucilaginibacter sp. CSA2-8R]|uniref:RNA polymerase sigma factor n=1 Tax=Mucilaginibacter sp. CSA2-8R TaxID=3141542 RepID=UPI00315DB452
MIGLAMRDYCLFTPQELLSLVKGGDKNAFTEIYNRYYDVIFRFLKKYLKSNELADDVCQNVFLKCWEQRHQAVTIEEPVAWLLTVAKRQAIDTLRRASVEQNALHMILSTYEVAHNQCENDQLSKDYLAFINQVVDDLPEQTRLIFKLCRQQNLTYDETADVLGISKHTVKKHMVRSMKILKNAADDELGLHLLMVITICLFNNH